MTSHSALDWLMPASQLAQAQEAGHIFVIRCMPDAFTGEMLNIGVCGIDAKGQRVVKVISEPGRLTCLYGEAAHNIVALAATAKEAAMLGHAAPSEQLVFDTPTPFYNSTLADVVEHTFVDQVTVALPHRAPANPYMLDDEQALQEVANAIKLAKGLDMDLLANTPQVLLNTDKGPRAMRIPLQPPNGVGTVRSAYYSHTTLRMHLMDSVLDMECAARYRQKKHMGVFILRPGNAPKEVVKLVDGVIDSIAYRAPKSMVMEVAYDAPALAQAIEHWAKQ